MFLLDLTLPTLAENLALDEALLLDAEAGGPEVLRFWNWPRLAVVVGAGGRLEEEADVEQCAADQVPIARRSSGGGTVLIGPGCLLYSLILSFEHEPRLADLHASYRFILDRLVNAFTNDLDKIAAAGISDLTWRDRKFSGNAQQRKRGHVLHHGTLLHAFDLAMLPRYLRPPPRMPEYRQNRPHGEFVVNLPLDAGVLRRRLSEAWHATEPLAGWPEALTGQLVREKYALPSWHARR
jgi:lipoate-protein ligase A